MSQVKTGIVVSAKMTKTVVVEIKTKIPHPLYKKLINKTQRIKAHDEIGTKPGQVVKIAETKPVSRDVHFKVVEVVNNVRA